MLIRGRYNALPFEILMFTQVQMMVQFYVGVNKNLDQSVNHKYLLIHDRYLERDNYYLNNMVF